MKKRILIIGSITAELSFKASRLANGEGEVLEPIAYELTPGGSAGVGACAVSRLGGDVIVCGCVGGDEYGKSLVSFFNEFSMDTRFIKVIKNEKTDISVVENGGADQRVYRSTNLLGHITPDLVEDAFTTIPDAVYVSLDVPADAVIRVAELAREKGTMAFFDGERIPTDFPIDRLGVIDLVALPPEATERLTGIAPRDAMSNLKAAVELHKTLRSKTYMFKFGVGGAFEYKGNFSYYIPYVEDAPMGYRDLLVPAMIVENLRSGKSVRATRYASTVVALASRKEGSVVSTIPSETEVLRYILEHEVEL